MEYMNNLVMNIAYNEKTNTIRDKISKTDMILNKEPIPIQNYSDPFGKSMVNTICPGTENILNYYYPNNTLKSLFKNLNDFTIGFWMLTSHSSDGVIISIGRRNSGGNSLGIGIYMGDIFINITNSVRIFNDDGGGGFLNDYDKEKSNIWYYVELYFKHENNIYIVTHSIDGRYEENIYNGAYYSENITSLTGVGSCNTIAISDWIINYGDWCFLSWPTFDGYESNGINTLRYTKIYDFAVYNKIMHTSDFVPPYREVYEDYKRLWCINESIYGIKEEA